MNWAGRLQADPAANCHIVKNRPSPVEAIPALHGSQEFCACAAAANFTFKPMTYVDAAVAPLRKTGQIKIHGPPAFEGMRKAGQLVARCLDMLTAHVKAGVTTEKIDRLVFEYAHGSRRAAGDADVSRLQEVDLHIAQPCGLSRHPRRQATQGWRHRQHRRDADPRRLARQFQPHVPIGEIPRRAERLIEVTHEAMMRGIGVIRPGATTGDIGHAIQAYVETQHMSVVRDFCGHGLGRLFHDEPNIVHVGRPGEGVALKPGMFFTVEPMINIGRPHVKVLSDGWTAVTRDRSLSAQFEHTVAVTNDGVEVFTFSPAGLDKPPYKR